MINALLFLLSILYTILVVAGTIYLWTRKE